MVGILTELVILTLVIESFYLVNKVKKLEERVKLLELLFDKLRK